MTLLALLLCLSDVQLENGPKLHYQVEGSGQPLLLIGGLGNRLNVWDQLTPLLTQHFTVYRFDNRGIGESGDLEGSYTLETMADDAAGLMAALKIEKYHVAGISLGSFVAQKMAMKYGDQLKSLVLMASSPGGPEHVIPEPEILAYFQKMGFMERSERVEKGLLYSLHPDFVASHPKEMKDLIVGGTNYVPPPGVIQRQMMIGFTFNHSQTAAKIETPTLILHGEQDRIVPVKNAYKLHNLIKGSQLVIIKQSGHICIIDQSSDVANAMKRFLSEKQHAPDKQN